MAYGIAAEKGCGERAKQSKATEYGGQGRSGAHRPQNRVYYISRKLNWSGGEVQFLGKPAMEGGGQRSNRMKTKKDVHLPSENLKKSTKDRERIECGRERSNVQSKGINLYGAHQNVQFIYFDNL